MWYVSGEIDPNLPWDHPRNAPHFKRLVPECINSGLRGADLHDEAGFGLNHYAANSHVLRANKSIRLSEISNDGATTLLVGEVNANFKPWGHPVNWRDPARGINQSPQGFGGPRSSGGAVFLMADGSVLFISERVDRKVLRALATPRGGEEVDTSVLGPER
jgi:hypothetical protein